MKWIMSYIRIGIVTAALLATGATARATGDGRVSGRVSADGGGQGMVVYIEKAAGTGAHKSERPRIVQRNMEFSPRSVVVVQGQEIDFPNDDKFFHNVFSLSGGNQFDLGLYRGGASKSATMRAPGEVVVYCNIHPNMVARILVLQNDFFAQVGADGSYTISGLAPGSYTLVAWSPAHEQQKRPIVVKSGGAVKADFKLARRKEATSHLNKHGEQYGRYK